jgi:RNA polymerase sigma-70 factor (ECF subfamily)
VEHQDAKQTFEELLHIHLNQLYRFALYLTKKESDAEDLVQDTCMRALRFFHQFEAGTNFKAWIFTIMNNAYLSEQKRRSHESGESTGDLTELLPYLDEQGQSENPETLLLKSIPDAEVQSALRSLPEEFRAAIVLCDVEEMTYGEIADILNCPIGTVRSRIARARRQLYAELYDYACREGIVRKTR